jgi:hypothetical protein
LITDIIAAFRISAEILFQYIGEKEYPQHGKNDKKLDDNYKPCFPAPRRHSPEAVVVKTENSVKS